MSFKEEILEIPLEEVIELFKYRLGNLDSVGGSSHTLTITNIKDHSKEVKKDIKALEALKSDIDFAIEESLRMIDSNNKIIDNKKAKKKQKTI